MEARIQLMKIALFFFAIIFIAVFVFANKEKKDHDTKPFISIQNEMYVINMKSNAKEDVGSFMGQVEEAYDSKVISLRINSNAFKVGTRLYSSKRKGTSEEVIIKESETMYRYAIKQEKFKDLEYMAYLLGIPIFAIFFWATRRYGYIRHKRQLFEDHD